MDRRQRKTRKAILDACLSLIEEKDFQKITIHEIAERADINRGTFYLHFLDKYDMMDHFENEMIEKLEKVIVENLPEKRSNELFVETRYDTIVQILTSEMVLPKIEKLKYEISTDLFAIIFTSIMLSLAEYAYQSKTPIDIEQSADLLFNIVLHGPAKTLGLLDSDDSHRSR